MNEISLKQRRQILVAMCFALGAVVGSASGLNVAQQELAFDLNASQGDVLWIINSYVLALAALLMPMGAIADRWGRRTVLLAGFVVFALASAGAAFADSVQLMLAARIAAGVGAAMIMPVTLSVITTSFPPDARSQAIGVWAAVAGGGGILGMIACALLVDLADWQWLFGFPVVLTIVGLALTIASVPNSRDRTAGRFDLPGSILSSLGVGGLVFGIHEGPTHGWDAPLSVVSLIVGVTATLGFVAWELRAPNPLLDVRMFRDRRLSLGSSTLLLLFAVSSGVFVVLFPFFQMVLGWSAMRSILGMVPFMVAMMGASGTAAKVAARIGPATTATLGIGIATTGLALMALLVSVDGGFIPLLPGMIAIGLGMGLTMPIATEDITSSLPDDKQGVASALNDTTRELGSVIGVALLGAALTAAYRNAIEPELDRYPHELATAAYEGLGRALDVSTGEPESAALVTAARQAFTDGWSTSMWAATAAAAAMFVVLMVKHRQQLIASPGRIHSQQKTTDNRPS
jgi:EmrB/QacA subfamily drug resistance transporter